MKGLTFAALLGLQSSLVAGQARPIGDLFIVDQRSCANYLTNQANGVSRLQQNANEAAVMVESAFNILVSFLTTGNKHAGEYIWGFFKGGRQSPEVHGTVMTVLESTKNFLMYGIQPLGNIYKPRLYCDDNALIRQNIHDQALQLNGQPATDVNGNPVTISDLYARQIAATTENGVLPEVFLLQFPAVGNQPAVVQYYFFLASEGHKICSGDTRGETFNALSRAPVPVVVLCPGSFTGGRTAHLGGFRPRPPALRGQGTQPLVDLEPFSFTFMHEMFHFCPWNPSTEIEDIEDVESGGLDPYDLWDVLQFPIDEATTNAQNYALFALGAFASYHLTVPGMMNNQRYQLSVTYATGYCEYLSP